MYILNMNSIHLSKQLPASTLERREFVNHLATSKEDILAASRELIKESGWTAVSIRAVASRCSVSAGTIYNYYESKADLLGDTIESIWREIFFRSEDEQVFKDVAACISWIYKRLEYGNEQEMVNYSKNNILAQAGQSMLAQANQSNQGVLSLLQ